MRQVEDYECQVEKDLDGNDHKLKDHLPESKIIKSLSDYVRNGFLSKTHLECYHYANVISRKFRKHKCNI
jgi:hypothetical protein